MKWIVFAALALLTLAFVLRGGLRYRANFTDWARRLLDWLRAFWERLFGERKTGTAPEGGDAEIAQARRVPFHAFANPFLNGRLGSHGLPADLVRYSFAALESGRAIEYDCGRATQETSIEFANRLADEVPALEDETKLLGSLHARVLYARGALTPNWRGTLEDFWSKLEQATESRRAVST